MKFSDRTKRIATTAAYIVACLLGAVILAGAVSGCSVQPVDSVTGAKVGAPESVFAPHPTTSPDGNPITLKPNGVDRNSIADGVEAVSTVVQTTGPSFGPWGVAVAAIAGALTPTVLGKLRKTKKTP